MAKGSLRVNGIIVDTDGEIKASTGDAIVIREDDGSAVITVDTSGNTLINGDTFIGGNTAAETLVSITPRVQLEGLGYADSSISAFNNSNDTAGAYLYLGKSRGTSLSSDTIVQDGDTVGGINFVAADGTDRASAIAAIYATVDGTPGANDTPGELVFHTVADGANDISASNIRMVIKADGKVGIGTTAPDGTLHIHTGSAGSVTADITDLVVETDQASGGISLLGPTSGQVEIAFGDSGDANIGRFAYNNASNYFAFVTNASEAMRIDSAGSVGIGTTAPNFLTHGGPVLSILGGSTNNNAVVELANKNAGSGDGLGQIEFLNFDGGSSVTARSIIVGGHAGSDDASDLRFYTEPSGGSTTERMRIGHDGNIGISTTAPDGTLHIHTGSAGSITADGASNDLVVENSADAGISILSPQGYYTRLYFGHDADADAGQIIYGGANVGFAGNRNHMLFYTNGSERMRIASSGEVGIGSNAPAYTLDVGGTARMTGVIGRGIAESSSGVASDTFCFEGVNTSNVSTSHGAVFASKHSSSYSLLVGIHDTSFTSSPSLMVRGDGKIFAASLGSETGHTALGLRSSDNQIMKLTSSGRFKSNIVDTTIDSTLIGNIKCRDFTWTETGNELVGLIAEEVNEHIPKAVVKATENGETVCESVDYHALTALLIDYSQKLEERISQLESAG